MGRRRTKSKENKNKKKVEVPKENKNKKKVEVPKDTIVEVKKTHKKDNFLEDLLTTFVDVDIFRMKDQYFNISNRHNDLFRLPSEVNFKLDPAKPNRSETLSTCMNFISAVPDINSNSVDDKREKNEKSNKICKSKDKDNHLTRFRPLNGTGYELLRNMHIKNVLHYIEQSTIYLEDLPLQTICQVPSFSHIKNISFNKNEIGEILQAGDFVQESLKMKESKQGFIRILSYEFCETRDQLTFEISIPEIGHHDKSKIELTLSETTFAFNVKDLNGTHYIFEQKYLAHNVVPKNSSYEIIEEDCVSIVLTKKKKGIWKHVESFSPNKKESWESEMKNFFQSLPQGVQNLMYKTKIIWQVALVLISGGVDFLNLPDELKPIKRSFKSLHDIIIYYKAFITVFPIMKPLQFILGGAIYEKLILTTGKTKRSKSKILPTTLNKQFLKYVNEANEIRNKADKYLTEFKMLYLYGKLDDALKLLYKMTDLIPRPDFYYQRSACLYRMERFEEAFSDSLRALRILGPNEGFHCLIMCISCDFKKGDFIKVVDLSYSLPFFSRPLQKLEEDVLEYFRTSSIGYLDEMFKAYKLVLRKKIEASLPHYERALYYADTRNTIGIQVSIVYFLCKKYKEALDTAEKLIITGANYKIMWYIKGMATYYCEIDIEDTLSCLQVPIMDAPFFKSAFEDVRRIKFLIDEGDKFLQSDNVYKAIDLYYEILRCEKENVRLLSIVWLWIGYLQLRAENYLEAIKSFSSNIVLCGGSIETFRMRSIAYTKLCRKQQ